MSDVIEFAPGGYRFIPSVFQYSGGVAALPGHRIVRKTLSNLLPVKAGFDFIADHLKSEGLSLQNFCACELRSPGQFTDDSFRAFNKTYIVTLREWGIMNDDVLNPVARSNVCPDEHAPSEPSFYAFSYTRPADKSDPPSAVISGSAEAREPQTETELYRDRIVRYGETSPDALRDKVLAVVEEMERRLASLGFSWTDTTAVQAYSVRDFHHMMSEIARRHVTARGLTWHFARPPVVDLEYEMDCRVVHDEATLL